VEDVELQGSYLVVSLGQDEVVEEELRIRRVVPTSAGSGRSVEANFAAEVIAAAVDDDGKLLLLHADGHTSFSRAPGPS